MFTAADSDQNTEHIQGLSGVCRVLPSERPAHRPHWALSGHPTKTRLHRSPPSNLQDQVRECHVVHQRRSNRLS